MNRDIQKGIGAILIILIGLYWCNFTLFQSLLLGLAAMLFWEVRDIRYGIDALLQEGEGK